MYEAFIEDCLVKKVNLTYEVRRNMAEMYGYHSVELLEKGMNY